MEKSKELCESGAAHYSDACVVVSLASTIVSRGQTKLCPDCIHFSCCSPSLVPRPSVRHVLRLQDLTTAVTMSTIMIASRSTTTADPTPAATPAVMDVYYVTMNRKGWYLETGYSELGTVKLTCTLGHLGSCLWWPTWSS